MSRKKRLPIRQRQDPSVSSGLVLLVHIVHDTAFASDTTLDSRGLLYAFQDELRIYIWVVAGRT